MDLVWSREWSSMIGETKHALATSRPGRRNLTPVARETLHDRVYAELRRSLIHGLFAAGEHSLPFDGSALASGVYLGDLRGDDLVSQRPLLLLK